MSFTSQAKDELCTITEMPTCCNNAMTYGLLLCGRSFNSSSMGIVTEHAGTAQLYAKTVAAITGKTPAIRRTLLKTVTDPETGEDTEECKYSVSVGKKEDRLKVLEHFGVSEKTVGQRINRANIADDCCCASFLRGAFLACATMTQPSKSYLLEFLLPYLHLSDDMLKLIQELNAAPKMVKRRSTYVIYFKNSEVIEDLLMAMGAQNSALEIMQVKIRKDVYNRINRRVNFETANISRTVIAGVDQLDAIRRLRAEHRFDELPEELQELANLREQYPESSLRDLGEMLSVSLSRSGVYHRLNKIVSIANSKEQK